MDNHCDKCTRIVPVDSYLYAIEKGGRINRWVCEHCWAQDRKAKAKKEVGKKEIVLY